MAEKKRMASVRWLKTLLLALGFAFALAPFSGSEAAPSRHPAAVRKHKKKPKKAASKKKSAKKKSKKRLVQKRPAKHAPYRTVRSTPRSSPGLHHLVPRPQVTANSAKPATPVNPYSASPDGNVSFGPQPYVPLRPKPNQNEDRRVRLDMAHPYGMKKNKEEGPRRGIASEKPETRR